MTRETKGEQHHVFSSVPADKASKSYALRRQQRPSLSVQCGISSVKVAFAQQLIKEGFRVASETRTKVLLDMPYSYAMRVLEQARTDSKIIVVTWNTCPEHTEDLQDLHPDALLSGEFFLRQDSGEALQEVLDRLSEGGQYMFTPRPRTVLTSRERAVLRCVARGWNTKRISGQLYIGEQTVKNRLRSVYRKLGLRNHAEATLYYWQIWQTLDRTHLL